ncbi:MULTISPECIES: nitroreductase family protein [Thermococcus]|uniref:NAD(P)H-flavin oxidoreductase n=2 Tax=Thermococcus sibiricus TaxID=172049 RepID=C6A1C1_THESM|nr:MULTISPECIES: nitroreductase family protein [Thermococcus]ACS89416.1 NAD(P)H-flavin oxidoreductase [Thermococcus sibiricus MM 739]KUK18386.1 MAG: NAD(P)H-flavin oxidoreductase [Thermococcus sibiricus]MBC7096019.1 nitroreductase family protein [Thermococcus sp.]HII67210.1 nitroreductase family protein [Thermococcaceae archaeon]
MELKDVINRRLSVRYYEDREVEEDKIRDLVKVGIRAPTASGLENWLFVVYKDKNFRKRIHETIYEAHAEYYRAHGLPEEKIEKLRMRIFEKGMYKAPVYIGVFVDKETRFLKGEEYKEIEFLWSIESAAMAIENLMLKAVELELGTCYIGVTSLEKYQKKLRKMTGLDDNWYLVGLIPVGYPAEKIVPRPRRKPLEKVLKVI